MNRYDTGGSSTGMKLSMSLTHITLADTRADSLALAAPFRRLVEIRSYELPCVDDLIFCFASLLLLLLFYITANNNKHTHELKQPGSS
jgi:hypothetical protein